VQRRQLVSGSNVHLSVEDLPRLSKPDQDDTRLFKAPLAQAAWTSDARLGDRSPPIASPPNALDVTCSRPDTNPMRLGLLFGRPFDTRIQVLAMSLHLADRTLSFRVGDAIHWRWQRVLNVTWAPAEICVMHLGLPRIADGDIEDALAEGTDGQHQDESAALNQMSFLPDEGLHRCAPNTLLFCRWDTHLARPSPPH